MTAVLLTPLFQAMLDNNGVPLASGTITSYVAGTTTPLATFTDATGTVSASNPLTLDSAGRLPNGGVWGSGVYKFELKNSAGATISTVDNVTAIYGSGDMQKAVYDAANISQQVLGVTAVQSPTNKTFDETNSFSSFKLARNSAQFDKTDTTLADVTGLSVNVTAGATYAFEAYLLVTASGANGIKLAMGGTCTITRMDAYGYGANGTGFAPLTQAPNVALGATICGQTTAAIIAEVKGTVVVNAAGTFAVQFAQNTASGTSSILIGSLFKVTKI